jgi:transcription antitermination factor NusG
MGVSEAASAPERRWYALRLRSNFEHKAFLFCSGRGLESLLPTYRRAGRKHGGPELIDRPLFPGYLFSRLDIRLPEKVTALQAPGVVEIVRFGGQAVPIPDREIESVRIVAQPDGGAQPHPYLREGLKVEVVAGPFKGAQGILKRSEGRRKHLFVVSIELLGRSVGVPIAPEMVEVRV